MSKKAQQKQSRFAKNDFRAHVRNAYEIDKEDREYLESLPKEERNQLLTEKQRSEEAYRLWEKESEDSSSTSGGIINAIKNTASAVVDSAKNFTLSDIPDTFRMWTEGLYTMLKDEDLENINKKSNEQGELKMMARYKQLNQLRAGLEDELNGIEDINSERATTVLQQLNSIKDELSKYDDYFLTEGRHSDIIAQQMFDFNKLDASEIDRLHREYTFRDVNPMTFADYAKNPLRAAAQDLKNIVAIPAGILDYTASSLAGVIDHYLHGNGYSYDGYMLGRAVGYLDQNDPILKKAYKGDVNSNLPKDPKTVANSIDSSAVGEYDERNNYIPGTWYNDAERKRKEALLDYEEHKNFLKDGKITLFGAVKDGIDIVDFEDINPQFRKEHEQYGSSFSDIVAHPLHGLVETNSTVGMLTYQLPQMGLAGISKLAARRIPAIAAVTMAAEIPASIWGVRQSRQSETATEAMGAITERVVNEVTQKGGDIQAITDQLVEQANFANLDMSDYVAIHIGKDGKEHFIPKDEKSLLEILKIGAAFNFSTTDKVFEDAKRNARKGINKLINANNALAVYDYVQTIPFTSFWGSAMKRSVADMSRQEVQKQLERNITKQTIGDKLSTFIAGGKLTPAQQKLLNENGVEIKSLTDKAIDKATKKYLNKDVAKALKIRDIAKYAKNKVRLVGVEGSIEGLEEVNQTMLTNRYKRGEYDDYDKSISAFNLNEIYENVALSINGIGNLLGINTSDPDNSDNELRKAFNIGFASSILFSGGSHALKNIYGADESNLSLLLVQLKDDSTIGKVVAEQQSNTQDLVHLGMFYDSMKKGKNSPQYIKERLDFLKNNLDKENSLVTDGFIDADKKLVDAMDLVLNNENLAKVIDTYKSKFDKKANKQSGYDAKKRMYVNAAKAVADANTAQELVQNLLADAEGSFKEMLFAIDRLFIDDQISDEQIKQFEQENPKLFSTVLQLLNDHLKYKKAVQEKYEKDKTAWVKEHRKSSAVLDVDFSEEYDEAQIDEMYKALKDDNKFATNEFVSAIIRNEALDSTPRARAIKAKELGSAKNRLNTIRRAYELKKGGFSQRDFVMDRVHAMFLNEQKRAAEAVQSAIKNQSERQQRIAKLTGLDIDVNRIIGVEKAIDDIVAGYKKRIDSLLGNDEREQKVNLDDIFTDDYLIDDKFISQDALLGLMLAEAIQRPAKIRKHAYLYGSQNPISIRDFLNSTTDENVAKYAERYSKIVDDLRNGSLSDDVTAAHDNEKELTTLSEKAAKDLILQEIKDQEKRQYIANKRKESEPITTNDVEAAENGDEEAARKINKQTQLEQEASVSGQSEGERAARNKFNGGQKLTKSEKLEKIKEQRDKIDKFRLGANTTEEHLPTEDDEEHLPTEDDNASLLTTEELKDEFDATIAKNASEEEPAEEYGEGAGQQEQEEVEVEDVIRNDEDKSNDSEDHANDETPEDIPVDDGELTHDDEGNGELSDEALSEVLSEENRDQSEFFIGAEEEHAFHGLLIGGELGFDGEPTITKKNGDVVNTQLVDGQLQQLIDMENGVMDQSEAQFDGKKENASEDTIGDLISQTLFYNPDPKDKNGNPIDEPIKLSVDGKEIKLPKKLASGRKLAEKLILKGWINSTKKYWVVTQSLESQNTKHTERQKDTMTVCLILEDDLNCYAVTYRRLGESKSVEKDSNGKVVKLYTTDYTQQLKNELYVKGLLWNSLIQLRNKLLEDDIIKDNEHVVPQNEPLSADQRAKIAKPIFLAYAKELARKMFTIDKQLGNGSETEFENWFKGLRPSRYKLKENDPQYLADREKRQNILDSAYQMARASVMKAGRQPISEKQIDQQIERLRKNRNEIIDAYLTLVEDKQGHKHFIFPKEIRTDVTPETALQSNGKINTNTIPDTNVHIFGNVMPNKSIDQITEEIESGRAIFGFGLGKFGSVYEGIQKLFTDVTERELITTDDGRSIGVGKAGKIYMLIDSPTGTKVPIMLRESRFNKQYVERNGKLESIFLDDVESWNGTKNNAQFKECFEIDQKTGRPRLIEDLDGYKPSIAEILFYMVCGKFNTPNFTIDAEYFIHNGERTLIQGTDKFDKANQYLGPKQLYFGPVGSDGQPLLIERTSQTSIPLSQYGLIIGMLDEDGVYRQHVFMHDELFADTEQARNDRRSIIRAIGSQMHWSMDSFLLTEKANIDAFEDGFGKFVKYVLDQNKGKEECSFYGCPDLTFIRSDFEENGELLKKSKKVLYFSWCIKNNKLQTDLNFEKPFYAPFVFGRGVKETGRLKANEAAEKLGATDDAPAQLTGAFANNDEVLLKNAEYEEEYWTSAIGQQRKSVFDKIKSFLKTGNDKEALFDELNKQVGAKEHGGFKDIVVFRFPKDNLPPKDALTYLDKKIKEFVEKYNSIDGNVKIHYNEADLKQIRAESSKYANKGMLPVMNIYADGSVRIYSRMFSTSKFMSKGEGFTGMYSTNRGDKKVDIEKSRKWLQDKLGIEKHLTIVTDAILRGTNDEKVFGVTNASADAMRQRLLGDGYIILSSQSGLGIEYHEGWHYINLLLHDKKTRRAIHDSYLKTHKKLNRKGITYKDVEEAMAEDFRRWALGQEDTSLSGKIKLMFNRVINFLLHTEDKKLYMQIYKNIQSGVYAGMELDKESVDEFHAAYDNQSGAYSKVHGILQVSDAGLDNMPNILNQNDFFEALDGIVNFISYKLNLDSVEKIKAYSGKDFDMILGMVQELIDSQVDERNAAILNDILKNNPALIKKALQDYLMSIGINFKVKKVKQLVTNPNGEKQLDEIEVGQDPEDEALLKEDNPDNTWDKIDLNTSHKDNAALRAKMFLKRIPMSRRIYDSDGSVRYEQVIDRFGTPVYWQYDEVWNLVMNELWSCDTLDAKDKDGNYLPTSIRGKVKNLAKSNAMFYELDQKFEDIEDMGGDIELRSQIFTTISASKNPVMIGIIQDTITKNINFDELSDAYSGEDIDPRSMEDNGSIADRKRIFSFNNDSGLLVARNIPKTWSKNAALNGLVIYNAKSKKSVVSKEFANSVREKRDELNAAIEKYTTITKNNTRKRYTENELRGALYSKETGIRELFKDLCNSFGIPIDNDVLDAYVAMFANTKSNNDEGAEKKLTLQQQINIFSLIMSDSNGSLSKIVDDVVKSIGDETLTSSDKKVRNLDQLFNSYSESSNIGKLAIAYNYVHPQLSEYAVRDANGNLIYPINMPNELTDKTNALNKNSDLAKDMKKSKLCENSIILDAAENVKKNDPNTQLRLNTFAGLKDKNAGNGADHAGLTALEDILCKMFLTEMDHIVFPTMADKKTWLSLSSSNIKLSHDLILCGPKKLDELEFIIPAYEKAGYKYDESKYKDIYQYREKAYSWYLNLPDESDIKLEIFENATQATKATGQMTYKRFSDDTLKRFAWLFLDEINALIDYYDEKHIKKLVSNPNKLITNFHGSVSNGRMDFGGNGGKFRYFYDTYFSKDFTKRTAGNSGVSEIINASNMNLNQKLNALYELQKKIESESGVLAYVRNASGEKQIDPQYSKLSIVEVLGKDSEHCDGFELIRQFLKDLLKEIIENGEFTQTLLDSINDKLITMTEQSLELFSKQGDIMQLIYKDKSTGLYLPTKIPVLLLKPYLDKLMKAKLVDDYTQIYDVEQDSDAKFAEAQTTYSLIANFTVNTMLSVMEVEKVYTGEKAAYKWKKSKSTLPVRLYDYQIGDQLIDVTLDVEMLDDVFSDKIKRLGGTQSPGNKLRSDFNDDELLFDPSLKGNKYTVCNVEDIEIPSAHLDIIFLNFKTQLVVDYIRSHNVEFFELYTNEQIQKRKEDNKRLVELGKSKKSDLSRERIIDRLYGNYKLVNEIYDSLSDKEKQSIDTELAAQVRPYTNITVADAQVFVRPALYRKMRIRLGEWSIEPDESGYSDEIAYNICESDDLWMKDPTKSAIVAKFLINALKMSYFLNSPFNDAGMNINKAVYNKMALFPLFKMHRSTDVGRILYDRMNAKGHEIDQVAFKSAVKVGAVKNAPSVSKEISGIEKFVSEKYGISKSAWNRLKSSEKLKYQLEYSQTEDVKTALGKINSAFLVERDGDNVKVVRPNQYSVDYTSDNITENKTTDAIPISIQDLRNIRLLLNTKAHESDERSIGTQMFKLAFSNIIDDAEYGTEKSGRQSRKGYLIKQDIMRCLLRITNIGIDEIRDEFYDADGRLNKKAVRDYAINIAINNGLGETEQQLLAEGAVAAALMSRSVFEHSASSYVNKKVVDVNTKGGTAIQQSVFGFAEYGNDLVYTYYDGLYQKYNDGKELNWNAKEGSMEVLLSMNFFKPVVPRNVWAQGYSASRQWLIDNDIIKGQKSKEYWEMSEEDTHLYQLLSTRVQDLDFSPRTSKIFEAFKVDTLEDLINNLDNIKRSANVGPKVIAEINDSLESLNLSKDTKRPNIKPVYSNPKPFGIGYRIPTQGMSSMFSYIVADVLPEQVGDLIVVPREFTAQTGSDFDVDKIFLMNRSYRITDTEGFVEIENGNDDDTIGAISNTLLDDYIDIISDRRNFANARASIDVITNTIQSELLPILRGSNNEYIEGMSELLPYFLTMRKLEFGVGKTGIGPFALNVTNLSLTQYVHLTMDFGSEGTDFSLMSLDSIEGLDGRRISDWLSAMVNAHVDVAKDAYVRDLNVNQFTYNHANLLLRCGKGISTFSFLAQPVLKVLSDYMNNSGGVYGNNIDGSTPTQISKTKKKERFLEFCYDVYRKLLEDSLLSDNLSKKNRADAEATIEWVRWNFPRKDERSDVAKEKEEASKKGQSGPELPIPPADIFDFNIASKTISVLRNSSDINELVRAYMYLIQTLNSFLRLDKYAQGLSELVQRSQIDTKKFGNTIAGHINFINNLNHFISKSDMWVINDPKFISTVPLVGKNKKPRKKDVSYMALKKYFESTYLDKKLRTAIKYTKGILENLIFPATDAYHDIFTTMCSIMFGKETVECVDGTIYEMYGRIYKDETLKTIANAIDDIVRYNVFVNQGPKSIRKIKDSGNDIAIDFIGSGKEYVISNMKRILFGDSNEQPIFDRVAKLIKNIKRDPYGKEEYLDLIDENGEISNQFLLYLSPQAANENYPIGRMLLSTSQMNVSSQLKRRLMAAFDQLLSSEYDEIRKLAEDLAFYAYFSTYDQNTVNSFFDLVPPDYRKLYDDALRYALNHNHKIGVLGSITGMSYSSEEYNEDRESTKKDMVARASSEILDVLSRNFWYNDNIVPRFFTTYEDKNNSFSKKYGDVLPIGEYDPVSKRSFLPWIATTKTNSLYIKVTKGKTTMLYKKIGVVKKQLESTNNGDTKIVNEFNVYAVVLKAGLHKGSINQFEFYCNANTPSIFEDNQIISPEFAFDNVQKDILSEINDLKKIDSEHSYVFELSDAEIDPMYVSTNTQTYYHDPLAIKTDRSKERTTQYAKFERSVSSADRVGVLNADWTINLVSTDKGAEVNRSVSKPLAEAKNISDATLGSNTAEIVKQIVNSGKLDITIYITSTFIDNESVSQEEIDKLKKEKKNRYIEDNAQLDNVLLLADIFEQGLSDYDLRDEILEKKILIFLDSLVYDLKINRVKVKQLSAPLGRTRKPVAFGVIAAHKTHSDFFEDTKAIIYPVNKFVTANKKQFLSFLAKVQNMIDESPVTEDVIAIQENTESLINSVNKEAEQNAQKAIKKFKDAVTESKDDQQTQNAISSKDKDQKINKFSLNMSDELDIISESQEYTSINHEDC